MTARFPVGALVVVGAEEVLVGAVAVEVDEVLGAWLVVVVDEVLDDGLAADEQPARTAAHNTATTNDLLSATGTLPSRRLGSVPVALGLRSEHIGSESRRRSLGVSKQR